ncbi:uncharacterized protein LOC120347751 isoform X2 [Styela clava]
MEHSTTFWLTPATTEGTPDNINDLNDQQNKDADLASMFNQSTMINFASIFAGATAAVASSGSANMLNGQRVPPLTQIGVSPSKHTTLVPIGNLRGMPTVNQLTPLPQAQIISTSSAVVNSLNNITPLTTTIYTLPLPSEPIQIPKNFIQQAAAASGLNVASGEVHSPVTNNILISSQSQKETSLATTPQQSEAAMPVPSLSVPQQSADLQASYQCSECNKTFKSSGQLGYHTFVAHGELQARPHKCTACPESFLMDHHLRDHMKAIHLPPEQGGGSPYTCSECMLSFEDGGNLNFHLYMAHTIQGSKPAIQKYPCLECGKNFIKSSLLSAHMRNVHSGQVYALVGPNQVQATPATIETKNCKCPVCGKAFKAQSYMKQHIMSVHDKPLKCSVCERGFGRKSDLKRHMRGVHMKKRPHTCDKCGWTFSEIGNLKHHIQAVHHKEKNYRCMYCDKTFSLSSYLRTHLIRLHNINLDNMKTSDLLEVAGETSQMTIQTHESQPQLQPTVIEIPTSSASPNNISLQTLHISVADTQAHVVRCYECGQSFGNAQSLQNHVMSTHSQPFWCTVCGEGFSLASQLQMHLQLRHTSNEPPVSTNVSVPDVDMQNNGKMSWEIQEDPLTSTQSMACQTGLQSQQQNNLETDSQPTHVNIETNKCPLCGMIYDSSPDKHMCWKKYPAVDPVIVNEIAMHGDRPHLCSECGKGFKTTTHLKQHIRCVHAKDRPHKCTQCEKCFARTSDLNRHIRGVHHRLKHIKNTVFVTLKCSECGAIYAETSQLKRHIYTQHLRGRPSYKCADCQEGFADEASFQNHICHEEERPHVCSVCAKRFQMAPQLRRHLRAAHGKSSDEPTVHKCFQCERNFGRPIDLERHIQAVHLKEKPHRCTLCGKSFGLQGNLNKHVRAVHLMEKPHQCIECGKRFAHVGVLKRHLRDIHFYDKKASVKHKLAQIQIDNAKAMMRNIANMQQASAMLNETQQSSQQMETPESMQQANNIQTRTNIQVVEGQTTDLPTIDNIATIARQQIDNQTQQCIAHQISTQTPQPQQIISQNTPQVATA